MKRSRGESRGSINLIPNCLWDCVNCVNCVMAPLVHIVCTNAAHSLLDSFCSIWIFPFHSWFCFVRGSNLNSLNCIHLFIADPTRPPPVGPPWDYSSEKDTLVIVTADGSFYKVCRQGMQADLQNNIKIHGEDGWCGCAGYGVQSDIVT